MGDGVIGRDLFKQFVAAGTFHRSFHRMSHRMSRGMFHRACSSGIAVSGSRPSPAPPRPPQQHSMPHERDISLWSNYALLHGAAGSVGTFRKMLRSNCSDRTVPIECSIRCRMAARPGASGAALAAGHAAEPATSARPVTAAIKSRAEPGDVVAESRDVVTVHKPQALQPPSASKSPPADRTATKPRRASPLLACFRPTKPREPAEAPLSAAADGPLPSPAADRRRTDSTAQEAGRAQALSSLESLPPFVEQVHTRLLLS